MFRKNILISIITAVFIFTLIPAAGALEIYWRPAGDDGAYSQKTFSTTNRIDIQVRVDDAEEVTINGEEAEQIWGDDSDTWILDDYLLEKGENEITASADTEEEDDSGTLELKLVEDPSTGPERYVKDIQGETSVFSEKLQLEFPESVIIRDSWSAADDQGVTISTNAPGFNLSPHYVSLSPVYTVRAASPNLRVSKDGRLTIRLEENNINTGRQDVTVLYAVPHLPAEALQASHLNRLNSYRTGENSITVDFQGFGHYMVARVVSDFRDFYPEYTENLDLSEYREPVMALWARGIMDKLDTYPDGSEVPPDYFGLTGSSRASEIAATRKEFISMLVQGFRLSAPGYASFTHIYADLQNMDPQLRKDVAAASRAGWLPRSPLTNNKISLNPDAPLTREYACALAARAAGYNLPGPEQAKNMLEKQFPADYNSIKNWNTPHVMLCVQAGISPADKEEDNFRPGRHVTRGEAAEMVYKLLRISGEI